MDLHGLPRPPAAAGVQRGPPHGSAHPVRQLPENPVLRPTTSESAASPPPERLIPTLS